MEPADQLALEDARHEPVPADVDPFAGGYPVPPLPGQTVRRSSGPQALSAGSAAASEPGEPGVPVAVGAGTPQTIDQDEEVRGG